MIGATFYKNVQLLTQVVLPSYEFKKVFSKGMFNKPNTSGFIHVSHYLLSIYNPKCFQRTIIWPVMSKADEKRYRVEVKDYLEIVSQENLDMSFTPITLSHLLKAQGMRFLIIMWKLSKIALRAYIKREWRIELLQAPKLGQIRDLTETYFTNVNAQRDVAIYDLNNNIKLSSEAAEIFIKHTSSDLRRTKADIFKTLKDIKTHASLAPVSSSVMLRLQNPEDTEIVNLWKESIRNQLQYLQSKNAVLNQGQTFVKKLSTLVISLLVNPQVLDVDNFSKVNIEALLVCGGIKHLMLNGSLTFQGFFKILNHTLEQVQQHIRKNNLIDFSQIQLQVNEHYKAMKSFHLAIGNLIENVSNSLHNLQEISYNYNVTETDFQFVMNREMILLSPKINFSFKTHIEEKQLFDRLWVSPVKGKYKKLFQRHNYNVSDIPKQSTPKLQYNKNMQNTTEWKSPCRHSLINKYSPKLGKISPKLGNISPKYARLFSNGDQRRFHYREHSTAPISNQLRINTTPKQFKTNEVINRSEVTLDAVAKNLFDLSQEVTNVVATLCSTSLNPNSSFD